MKEFDPWSFERHGKYCKDRKYIWINWQIAEKFENKITGNTQQLNLHIL